jgi:hypothetical protein
MLNFCTLFDSFYLIKGLALYESLVSSSNDVHLYVMAFDEECYDKLLSLNLEHMTVELWTWFEKDRILEIKKERTRAEYCWSCGPSVIYHFLVDYNLPDVTYLDSDLYFVGSPLPLFDEIGEKSIAITEQGISEKSAKLYGKYCVQFLRFRNDEDGLSALNWWKESCLQWCFQRFEDGKYGDQKYLDDFPVKFKNVHVISNLGAGIAPWNMHKYIYKGNDIQYEGRKFPMIFIHMHGFKISLVDKILKIKISDNYITEFERRAFVYGYAKLIKTILAKYFGKEINSYNVKGQNIVERLEYKLRDLLRRNRVVQFLYFSFFKKTYRGHGLKI